MKYTCTVDINLPKEKVVDLWNDQNNYKEWQDGFQYIELLSGEVNTEGAKSKILLQGKKSRIELIETIVSSNLPNEITAIYEHKHMTNTQTTKFESIENNKTKYISEVEYTQFNGIMIKLLAKLFPGKFKAQSQKWMIQFKNFAEQSLN